MDKLHFDDLTKITCPPGFLDDDTLQRLEAWPHGREFWGTGGWIESDGLFSGSPYVNRARPAPITQDVVPWHLLDDRLKVAVWDNGVAWAAEGAYLIAGGGCWAVNGKHMRIDLLKGYQRGTVDWRNSRQLRPEGV